MGGLILIARNASGVRSLMQRAGKKGSDIVGAYQKQLELEGLREQHSKRSPINIP